jgi:hypothetical protein
MIPLQAAYIAAVHCIMHTASVDAALDRQLEAWIPSSSSLTTAMMKWVADGRAVVHRNRNSILTLLCIGGLTVLFYYWKFRRRPAPLLANTNNSTAAAAAATTSTAATNKPMYSQPTTAAAPAVRRLPTHVAVEASAVAANGANLLHHGVVAFRFSSAAALTIAHGGDDRLRRDRAQLLARLLASSSSATTTTTGSKLKPPPKKGSTLVISIPIATVDCPYQRYGLYLLATYYTVFVILVQSSSSSEALAGLEQRRVDAIAALRGDAIYDDSSVPRLEAAATVEGCFLSPAVLPTHRILSATTVSGRVAIVRQLQAVEAIFDYDAEVHSLLTRFGHVVFLYNATREASPDLSSSSSSLPVRSEFGKLLL